jgi:hypothetical protein
MDFDLRFTDKEITAWGGMGIMKRMLDHLHFDTLRSVLLACHNRGAIGATDPSNSLPNSCFPYGVAPTVLSMVKSPAMILY